MTRRKRLLLTGSSLLVLVATAFLLLMQNLDTLVRSRIERYGSAAAGTEVRVADVKISLSNGRGTLSGLTVANPPGYSPSPLFALNDIAVILDTLSLTAAVPVVEELRIGATAFHYEVDQERRSNLSVLKKQLTSAKAGSGNQEQDTERRLKIRRLVIADGEATFDLGRLGTGRGTARVPGVTLTDLGGEQGLTPQELSKVVLDALVKNLERSVANAGLQRLLHGKTSSPTGEMLKGLLGH